MQNNLSKVLLGVLVAGLVYGCQEIKKTFSSESPREKFANAIQESPLADNRLVQQWLAKGDTVLNQAIPLDIPFQTKLVYFSDEPNAWAWQFSLDEGRTLRAHLARTDTSNQVFMDLFTLENGEPELQKSIGESDSLLSYTMEESQTVVLRVQPELMVTGSATLTITDNPSMQFPVEGAIRSDIGSFWGDPRDGGRRKHKGVDIFADRGTPVVATADGRVSRTGNGGLGGKTVWMRANGKAMYYAHLDSINTDMGEGVQTGDTLGFVGNTGNARTTPPHLHFGIYDRGAVNPLPFIDFANTRVEPVLADPLPFPKWGRVGAAKANVRPLPSTQEPPLTSLSRDNPVQITGGTGEWYQVILPDGRRGFIHHSLLEPAGNSLRSQTIQAGDTLFSSYANRNPILTNAETVAVHGQLNNRQLVRFRNHWMWIKK